MTSHISFLSNGTRRSIATISILAVGVGASIASMPNALADPASETASGTAARATASSLVWGACPKEMVKQAQEIKLNAPSKAALARMQCATIDVPSDWSNPASKPFTLMITKVSALNPTTKPPLIFNTGGPGALGSIWPVGMISSAKVTLDADRDLYGYDPRGVGYGTRLECEGLGAPGTVATGKGWEKTARSFSRDWKRSGAKCKTKYGADVMASMTAANNARDLEAIRAALGAETFDYWGISWGTTLGAAYQTLYPERVNRMVLDSPVAPELNLYQMEDDYAAEREDSAHRVIRWAGQHPRIAKLGRGERAVRQYVRRLQASSEEANDYVAGLFGGVSPSDYRQTAKWLRDYTDAPNSRAQAKTNDQQPGPWAPAELFNPTVYLSTACNDQTGQTGPGDWIKHAQTIIKQYPITGSRAGADSICNGWAGVTPLAPTRTSASSRILLVGHRWEPITPWKWTGELQAAIGGQVLKVKNAEHGNLGELKCAGTALNFLDTGTLDQNSCTK